MILTTSISCALVNLPTLILFASFEPDARPSLLDMARIEYELSAFLGGRRVDLRTAGDLSRYFRDEVIREAEVQFVAA